MLAGDGRRLALDAQGPLREAEARPAAPDWRARAPTCSRHVQALKLSEEEALAAFGTLDPAEIATAHRRRGGARHARRDRRAASRPGRDSGIDQLEPVAGVDPTGAGDSFLALYADGRAEGLSPLAAAEAACADVSAVLAARLAASSGSIGRGRPVSQS